MGQLETYLILLAIIVVIGQLFSKSPIPISLLLVITGMLLSLVPIFPHINLNPTLVLNVFLPVLVYQISAFTSWQDFKKNLRPIALLSVGHVIFIVILIAVIMHALIPQLSWPLAFVLGAVIAPPDSVAIVSIAEKIRMPARIVTVLEGEGMLNDATALILFRFALAAVVTHEFYLMHAVANFFAVVIGETLYGLVLGYAIGELRLKLRTPMLHITASILTPFLAYLPAEMLGGCGVLATVVTGFVIGHIYSVRFAPEFRLVSRAMWPALAFVMQSILFLLVGLDLRSILDGISSIATHSLLLYGVAIIATIIVGRFIWVYFAVAHLPRFLFPSIRKKDPQLPWQFPFVVSWAGMRGGISLAAALAVPLLPAVAGSANSRDLLIFLVFCAIAATLLLQGLTLPWLLKAIGISKYGQCEKYTEHLAELSARKKMSKAVLRWLVAYKEKIKEDQKLLDGVKLYIREYRMLRTQLRTRIDGHNNELPHDEKSEVMDEIFLLSQIIEIERTELLRLWRKEEINLTVRNKLLERLDHRAKHLPG
jgi:Na+/H+ antiporter